MTAVERIPPAAAVHFLLAAIAGNEPDGGRFELRYRTPGGRGMGQHFHPAKRPQAIVEPILELGERTDVYVGAAPRRRDHGGADAIERVWCLWVDCDGDDAVAALRAFRPLPTFVIRTGTGGNVHAWWALHGSQPLTPAQARRANRRLAHALGADMRSTDPARILRLPGTRNHKHDPPAPVECVRLEPTVFLPRDVVGRLADPPDRNPTAPPRRPANRPGAADTGDAALLSIPPTVYVPALTGRELGRDGKVACPFHDDRTPSLHAYPDPERGWTCFGCGRGGSIIDLAAGLYGVEPRGRGYHDLRRRLAAELLGHAA